jgi:hypothetical protein
MIRTTLLRSIVLVCALGCGGRASKTSAGMSSGTVAESGSSSGSDVGSGSTQESDGGTIVAPDAETPSAFPVTCPQYTFALDSDAPANTCAITPADIACNSNADCTTYIDNSGCAAGALPGCYEPIYGVNMTNTIKCSAPRPVRAPGLYTQDCALVPGLQNVTVACVNHQCLSFYAGAPLSE